MKTKALVILSGGQDSTTALFVAAARFDEVAAITFDYGQRHRIEIDAAIAVARCCSEHIGKPIDHEIVAMAGLLASTSPLTDPTKQLEEYSDYATMDQIIGARVELTFVPMRNLAFLVIAANRAMRDGCTHLITGVCEADNANYPDCRALFIGAAQYAIAAAAGTEDDAARQLSIETPLIALTKADTVRTAAMHEGCFEALAMSHTCYAGQRPPCGKCHACVLRAEGFRRAGHIDPLTIARLPLLPSVYGQTLALMQTGGTPH